MKLFSWLYGLMLNWAGHRYASRYLAAVSFAESSFFPIPPDVMLVPMSLARPHNALRYASIATVFSIFGGIFGYALGIFAAHWLMPLLMSSGYKEHYLLAVSWFQHWGVWVVIIAGFSPIPYKIFTITAGLLYMPLLPFVVASFIGRGGRFFLVAGLLYIAGHKIEPVIRKSIDWVGWSVLLLLIVAYLCYTQHLL